MWLRPESREFFAQAASFQPALAVFNYFKLVRPMSTVLSVVVVAVA